LSSGGLHGGEGCEVARYEEDVRVWDEGLGLFDRGLGGGFGACEEVDLGGRVLGEAKNGFAA